MNGRCSFLGWIAVVQYMWFQRIYGAYPYCVACPECLNMNSDDSFTECLNAVGCPSTVMNKWTEPGIRMYFCSMPIFSASLQILRLGIVGCRVRPPRATLAEVLQGHGRLLLREILMDYAIRWCMLR